MHNKTDELLKSLGELVQQTRSLTMDQEELGKRVGLSRSTISAIERGKGVNSKALLDVLVFLGLSGELLAVIEKRQSLEGEQRFRKVRKTHEELSNDF
ncbi:helix-turn-helix domain-containing protein [Paraneptunicella aestuarii]|uniref:helix-turn-helix domain-containing protein n=1 Tax=Paraneptunicella aestuarii TaxID=2831148 RepID=UPI001E502AB2|nr:helix-turn-helix transcriptional regulator [Paraneptunicella aestuarii]UAA38773.1 helix-turn-helix domain-containing protein [Paraneptunicella aestuarii]